MNSQCFRVTYKHKSCPNTGPWTYGWAFRSSSVTAATHTMNMVFADCDYLDFKLTLVLETDCDYIKIQEDAMCNPQVVWDHVWADGLDEAGNYRHSICTNDRTLDAVQLKREKAQTVKHLGMEDFPTVSWCICGACGRVVECNESEVGTDYMVYTAALTFVRCIDCLGKSPFPALWFTGQNIIKDIRRKLQ